MTLHLDADLQAGRDRFIAAVRDSGVVWGLQSSQGWACCQSNEARAQVLVFWSSQAEARRHAQGEWAAYLPAPIGFEDFVDTWLRGMHEDGMRAGVEFNADMAGLEMEPAELARALLVHPDSEAPPAGP
jgi:hypothetical protein